MAAAELFALIKPKKGKGTAPDFGDAPYDHDIWDDALVGRPTEQAHPKLLIMCGPPGCGKSTAKDELVDNLSIGPHVGIDTDAVRTKLTTPPIGLHFPKLDTHKGMSVMTGVTNTYNARLLNQAFVEGFNVVFDTTGRNRHAMSALLNGAKAYEYTISLAIVYASEDVCAARVASRNAHPDNAARLPLPIPLARSMYQDFEKPGGTASLYIPDPPPGVHTLYLYNNNAQANPRPPPLLLYHGEDDVAIGPVTPFQGFYNVDIREESPHLVLTGGYQGGKKRRSTRHVMRKRRKTSKRKRRTRRTRRR